ncbi:uncharacterized protein LOC113342148 [Papaver somniferum]|uniref:uncharacterized protein LOC113342148 n=1 Tax=Papaver somniferum TaxID=3469 RepID=UPI000E7052BA|nr:uncharacterized protein LOC113342148 [Papaver somniferum]
MDNKTFGFKDPQIFWGGGYINEDGYTLFRFETQSGFDSFWNALRASTSRFVGNYFLNAEFEKGDDNYPDQLLSWRKDFEIWSEAHVRSSLIRVINRPYPLKSSTRLWKGAQLASTVLLAGGVGTCRYHLREGKLTGN